MKFRVGGKGWPVGDALVQPGTEVDTDLTPGAKGLIPPVDAQALDDATYQFMKHHYTGIGYGHLLGPPPPASK